MKVIKNEKENLVVHEFNNLREFRTYIEGREENEVFRGASVSSKRQDFSTTKFTKTSSWEEALLLFTHGWAVEAKVLNEKLKNIKTITKTINKNIYGVAGYQASVPRYLQGIPTNMVSTRRVKAPCKIINLVKNISYSTNIKSDEIQEESVKALHLVKTLESQGYSVNLSIIFGAMLTESNEKEKIVLKIKIKNANERLNVSKMAFPLSHPSMLRRFVFRYMEVSEYVTDRDFIRRYGFPLEERNLRRSLDKDETLIPKFMPKDINKLKIFKNK